MNISKYYKDTFPNFPIPMESDSLVECHQKFTMGRLKLLAQLKEVLPESIKEHITQLFEQNGSKSFYCEILSYAKKSITPCGEDTKLKIIHEDEPSHKKSRVEHAAELETRIADFDLTSSQAIHEEITDYYCWDYLCGQGFASKYTDLYSLNLLLAGALLPGFMQSTIKKSNTERKAFYASLLSNPQEKKRELYQKQIQSLKPLVNKEGENLLDSLLDPNQTDLRPQLYAILQYAKKIESLGCLPISLKLQKVIIETLCLDEVFAFITKTFESDQRTQSYMEAHIALNLNMKPCHLE